MSAHTTITRTHYLFTSWDGETRAAHDDIHDAETILNRYPDNIVITGIEQVQIAYSDDDDYNVPFLNGDWNEIRFGA